jgi:hypothetical protein
LGHVVRELAFFETTMGRVVIAVWMNGRATYGPRSCDQRHLKRREIEGL